MRSNPLPQAYISEADRLYCAHCWEQRMDDAPEMDNDPTYWLFKKQDWVDGCCCHECGSHDGWPVLPDAPDESNELSLYDWGHLPHSEQEDRALELLANMPVIPDPENNAI